EGFPIEERMVRLGQQIKRLDTYHVPLVLANDLKTEIKLWVVSDKPSEQLQAEAGKAPEAEADEATEEGEEPAKAAAKAEKSAEEKPAKPRRKERAPKAAKAEAKAAAGEAEKA